MVVTRLELELRYQDKKLRGVTWKLTRSEHGFLPESSWLIAAQIVIPFLISGLGLVFAGFVMDLMQVYKIKKKKKNKRSYFRRVDLSKGSFLIPSSAQKPDLLYGFE